ncbi:saccharopine dehydrogenase NADP-binding domain-containing protein [Nonomuraea sp. SMC257]|uniref:Saccharopine dehydrogenase NADP-binding domain-containing protein n=1 Tax=Nonomuraea montanisoli TaxID=2741721 RepID=A0A7Y6M4T4_9ACTN|nr:saccharopine dehydrogenase NADP-binding domain-containing protein [Nonomuraea montanisoli]
MLVIGGYGAVGAQVSTTLDEWFPGRVVAAGRRPGGARLPGTVRRARLDLADVAGLERLLDAERVAAVVLCVEPADAAVAETCLSRGVHLVDVGASDHLLRQVEDLADRATAGGAIAGGATAGGATAGGATAGGATAGGAIAGGATAGGATAGGATAVLSVGLAPGLTNLLARRAHERVGGAQRIDITVLLGAGEHHGADAVAWTVARLSLPAAGGSRRCVMPGYGRRTAYPLDFSDQHSLRRTLGVPAVTTRMCLDSAFSTTLLAGLRRLSVFRAARGPLARRLVTAALSRVHIGGDGFAVRVDAVNRDRHVALALTGNAQSRATALVAAHVTRAVLGGELPGGVHHIDQLPALADLPDRLAAYGIVPHTMPR